MFRFQRDFQKYPRSTTRLRFDVQRASQLGCAGLHIGQARAGRVALGQVKAGAIVEHAEPQALVAAFEFDMDMAWVSMT